MICRFFGKLYVQVLLLGVARFMSEARSITNIIGNAVGKVAIARWVGSVDRQRLADMLDGKTDSEDLDALYEGGEAAKASPVANAFLNNRQRVAA